MNPKIAQSLYQLGTVVSGLVGLFLVWGGIDAGAADSLNQIIGGLLALMPGAANAVAAKRVSGQRKDGTLGSPADQVTKGVQAVLEAQAQATAEVEKVKQAVTAAVGTVPGMGPLAQQLINSVPSPWNRP